MRVTVLLFQQHSDVVGKAHHARAYQNRGNGEKAIGSDRQRQSALGAQDVQEEANEGKEDPNDHQHENDFEQVDDGRCQTRHNCKEEVQFR